MAVRMNIVRKAALVVAGMMTLASTIAAQPKFEVVSIKACKEANMVAVPGPQGCKRRQN